MLKRLKPQKKTKRDAGSSTHSDAQSHEKKILPLPSLETKTGIVPTAQVALSVKQLPVDHVRFENVIKATDDGRSPFTVAVELGKKKYVIKARTVDVDDHVINTNILRALSIPGVRAPAAVKVTPELTKELDASLGPASVKNPDIGSFLDALKSKVTPAQLSERAPGYTLEKILDPVDSGPMLKVVESAGNPEEAIDALLKAIPKPSNVRKDQEGAFNQLKEDVRRTKGEQRIKAIKALKDALSSPASLKRIEIIEDVHRLGKKEAVKKGRQEEAILARADEALLSLAAAPEGAYALGALAVTDILCGMDDRIMGKWNGANFMFDPEQGTFWCIDNAKAAKYGLSDGDEDAWSVWAAKLKKSQAQTLPEVVYDALYGGASPLAQKLIALDSTALRAAIGQAVTDTLEKAGSLLDDEDLPAGVRKRLQARILTLEASPGDDPNQPSLPRQDQDQADTDPTPTIATTPVSWARTGAVEKETEGEKAFLGEARTTKDRPVRQVDSGPTPKIAVTPSSWNRTEVIEKTEREKSFLVRRDVPTTKDKQVDQADFGPARETVLTPSVLSTTDVVRQTERPRARLVRDVPKTAQEAIAAAQRLWGPEPLPSDADSEQVIWEAVRWYHRQESGTVTPDDFNLRLSVMLKVSRPVVIEKQDSLHDL